MRKLLLLQKQVYLLDKMSKKLLMIPSKVYHL